MAKLTGLFVYIHTTTAVPTQVQVRDSAGNEFPLSLTRYEEIGCSPALETLPPREIYEHDRTTDDAGALLDNAGRAVAAIH